MSIEELAQIIGYLTTFVMTASALSAVSYFLFKSRQHERMRMKIEETETRRTMLLNAARLPKRNKPKVEPALVKKVRIEDVGIIAYINE